MNEAIWAAMREYIDAEIKLALSRTRAGKSPTKSESDRIAILEAQSTRMETAVRESLNGTPTQSENR
jgi:hypothetical protein